MTVSRPLPHPKLVDTKKWLPKKEVISGKQLKKRIKPATCKDPDGNLYMFGGVFSDLSFSQELAKFNPNKMQWQLLSENNINLPNQQDLIPEGRIDHTLCYSPKYLFLYGGKNHNMVFSDLFIFDLFTKKWNLIENKDSNPGKLFGHTAWLNNQSLYLLGGRGEYYNHSYDYKIYNKELSPKIHDVERRRSTKNGFWKFDF